MTYNLKKRFAMLALLLTAITTLSFAATVEVDGIRYVTNTDGTAYVTYFENRNNNNGFHYKGDITIPETIEADGKSYTVTKIDTFAFSNCSMLTSISLPSTITKIEGATFEYCYSLKSIGDMTNVSSIGNWAFHNCYALQSIGDMPNLTLIGDGSFSGCHALQSIGDMPNLTLIGTQAFNNCITLQSIGKIPKLSTISSLAFGSCRALQDIYLPESLTAIYSEAFSGSRCFVHFTGVTPPTFTSTSFDAVMVVPAEAINDYAAALPDIFPNYLLIDNITMSYDVTVSSLDSESDLHKKINKDSEQDLMYYVRNLKVSGTINGYDIMILRNKMLNLRSLDLSDATIVANPYEYYTGCHTEDNVVGYKMFNGMHLTDLKLPLNTVKLGTEALASCDFKNITIPESVISIENSAFSGCEFLEKIVIPPLVERISGNCFSGCSKLESVSLPPTVKEIGGSAFSNCTSLKELRIPAGLVKIYDSAIPSSVKDVYTYTIQPISIGQNTFDNSTYKSATLHVPETSEYLYYWDTQWSQFQEIVSFNEPYTYFYLEDKDLVENPDTPRIDGETDEETGEKINPDANLGSGSGLIVDGDNSQDLGNVNLENGASIIGGNSNTSESGGNVNIDMLNINLNVEANKWYFFSFPFDVKCENIKFNGQMVWRYYDGEWRAMNGAGAWKDNKEEYLLRGKGYIFQGSKKGTLTLSIPNAAFDAQDWRMELEQNVSEMAQDASWNFIGNPFMSYYELADLGFDGPITWWNPNTKSYEAYNPADDDMSMYPFMAFFVQKPEGVSDVEFDSQYRETNNQKNDAEAMKNARARRAARRAQAAADRQLLNLSISDENGSDRTRIVLNNMASTNYEVGVDASKFVSTAAPQIYSLDNAGVQYAINELPDTDAAIRLGIYAPENGYYTIECSRSDAPMTLFDSKSKKEIELAPGKAYQFIAEAGYDDSRFFVRKSANAVSVDALNADTEKADYYLINGLKSEGTSHDVMIEVKGNEVKKVIK